MSRTPVATSRSRRAIGWEGLGVPGGLGVPSRVNGGGEKGFVGVEIGRFKSMRNDCKIGDGGVAGIVPESAWGVAGSGFCDCAHIVGAFSVG